MIRRLLIPLCVLVICSCASTVNVLSPAGDTAVIRLGTKLSYWSELHQCELLAINDSTLTYLNQRRVYQVLLTDINSIHLTEYSIPAKPVIMIPVALVYGILGISNVPGVYSSGSESLPIRVGFLGICAAAIASALKAMVCFKFPIDSVAVQELLLHCRYPQGLTTEQQVQLLAFYGQEKFLQPPPALQPGENQ